MDGDIDIDIDESPVGDQYDDQAVRQNKVNVTVINTNARSLCPKINSLIDCFTDLNATIGVITEMGKASKLTLRVCAWAPTWACSA